MKLFDRLFHRTKSGVSVGLETEVDEPEAWDAETQRRRSSVERIIDIHPDEEDT